MTSTFASTIANHPDTMHTVFESLPEPTFLINKSGTYVEAWGGRDVKRHHNPSALVGLNQYQVLPADKAVWFSQVIVDVVESQAPAELEYSLDPKELVCFDGVEGPTEVQYFSALVIPLPETELVLWTVRNISEFKRTLDMLAKQQLELEKLTFMDHLTQLYNRYALDALLPDALELTKLRETNSAILMIDIDCFKQYNDHFGHLQGDLALKSVSQAILQWANSNDLCFRYGGDEFLAFLPDITADEVMRRAQALRHAIVDLNLPHPASTISDQVTVTIGLKFCQASNETMSAEKMVSIADKALFHAKNRQRGTIHQLDN
ncbi:GGDEF family protein [Vibrio sinaloensis DSM 21326]|uniref:diguanylate cyclase n=1 Tax=Vibrio sinaloensis DSM 21326 TaxID=945550 RepID=E8M8B8_PHOS4|nr:sensor domain-containing diguanylate cyclase [Vibrio sinaloensis]EGA69645.1 GGDEF family protein [Vibrio sinaloensis DSM 21326]